MLTNKKRSKNRVILLSIHFSHPIPYTLQALCVVERVLSVFREDSRISLQNADIYNILQLAPNGFLFWMIIITTYYCYYYNGECNAVIYYSFVKKKIGNVYKRYDNNIVQIHSIFFHRFPYNAYAVRIDSFRRWSIDTLIDWSPGAAGFKQSLDTIF